MSIRTGTVLGLWCAWGIALGCGNNSFGSTPTDTPDAEPEAGTPDAPITEDARDAGDEHVLPAGTLDDFEGPTLPTSCGAKWLPTDSTVSLVAGKGVGGSQACKICMNADGFSGIQTGDLVSGVNGEQYALEASAAYPDVDGGVVAFLTIHLSTPTEGGPVAPITAGIPGDDGTTYRSGTAIATLDHDSAIWVSVSLMGKKNDCVLVDDVKFSKR